MKDIWEKYNARKIQHEQKMDEAERMVRKYERLLDKAKKKADKLWSKSPRYSELLDDMCKRLHLRLECNYYEIIGPFGVECDYGLWFYDDSSMLTHPRDLSALKFSLNVKPSRDGHLLYWNGVVHTRYPKGSIADLNGLNYEWEHLPESMDEIVEIIRKLKTNGVK